MSKEKFIIILTVLIDVIGIGIVIPVLPFYVESFGASPFMVTLLFTVFSFFSFLSAPFLGLLSDKKGRRPILIISILSTAIGWFVFASANSIFFLFLGRIIDGMAAGNFSIAQSYLVDIAKTEKERTENLGLIGAVFGIGFIIGPMLGGVLGEISPAFPFWTVGVLSLINVLLAFFILPETHTTPDVHKKVSFNPLTPLVHAVKNKSLLPFFAVWFLFIIAMASQQSVFALYLDNVFGCGAFISGLTMTVSGAIIALNQIWGMKYFWLKKFQEKSLIFWMLLFLTGGLLLMAGRWIILFFIGLFIITIGHALLRVLLTSQISVKSGKNQQGEIMGMLSSIMSVGMIVGPVFAGYSFEKHSSFPFFIASGCSFIAFFIICLLYRKMKSEGAKEPVILEEIFE